MEQAYYWIDLIGLILSFIFLLIVLAENESKNQKYLLLTYLCGFTVAFGNFFEFCSMTPEGAMISTKVAYWGKCFLMLFAVQFATGFCRIRFSRWLIKLITMIDMILITLILTCEKHHMYYSYISYHMIEDKRVFLDLGKGPFYYVWFGQLFICIFWFAFMAFYEIIKKKGESKSNKIRMGLIVASSLSAVVIGYLFQTTDLFYQFDPTTIAVVCAEFFMLIDVKIFGLLDTMQAAQERILSDAKDGILVTDSGKKHILYANHVAKELFPEMVFGDEYSVVQRVFVSEENILEKEGRNYEIRISPITENHEILGYLGWIFDMTFINQYTNEMIKLKKESEQANIAKTNFLAHMSHEIRTPMNSIVGFSDLALRTQDPALTRGYLQNIKDSARTLLHLINEILDISKIETGKMEVTAVNYRMADVISEVRSMIEVQARTTNVVLKMEIDQDIPEYLVGDRVKVQEILINLLNNALKYTREGSVCIRMYIAEETEKSVLLHIEVEDTGIGIEEKNYPSVFGQFEQFDEKKNYGVEGSGLGLSIVKSFVEMMDGNITFRSVYGQGTTFIVDLWQEVGIGQICTNPQKSEETDIPVKLKTGNVLVVDDNDLNCVVAEGILQCLGMKTQVATSGKECLDKLKSGEQYDIIFMDHMMPEMDGVETLRHIRNLDGDLAGLPVVLLTANAVSGVKEEMLRLGFDGFLSKPIDIDELTVTLQKFIGKE